MRRTAEALDRTRCVGVMPNGGRCYLSKCAGKDTCPAHEDPQVFNPDALQAYVAKYGMRRWLMDCGAVEPTRRAARSLDGALPPPKRVARSLDSL